MSTTVLEVYTGTSRGKDTNGYRIVGLFDNDTNKRYKTIGLGYDMLGKVFGDWLNINHAEKLEKIEGEHLGLHGGRVGGNAGFNAMAKIAALIGLKVTTQYNKKGSISVIFVES